MARLVMMGAPLEAAGDDVAVGGGRLDVQVGGAFVVLERVVHPAVGGAGVQGGGDSVGGADRHVAGLGAQHDRAAHGLGDPDVALSRADLRGAVEAADRDVTGEAGEATLAASSSLIALCAPSKVTSPNRSTARSSALAAFALTREPAGSWTVTSMDPELPRIWFFAEASIRRTPSPYSTLVCSATFTSRPFEASAGKTSTAASARSAAMHRMRPAGRSRTAKIGAGVPNFCIVHSCTRRFSHLKPH